MPVLSGTIRRKYTQNMPQSETRSAKNLPCPCEVKKFSEVSALIFSKLVSAAEFLVKFFIENS